MCWSKVNQQLAAWSLNTENKKTPHPNTWNENGKDRYPCVCSPNNVHNPFHDIVYATESNPEHLETGNLKLMLESKNVLPTSRLVNLVVLRIRQRSILRTCWDFDLVHSNIWKTSHNYWVISEQMRISSVCCWNLNWLSLFEYTGRGDPKELTEDMMLSYPVKHSIIVPWLLCLLFGR